MSHALDHRFDGFPVQHLTGAEGDLQAETVGDDLT